MTEYSTLSNERVLASLRGGKDTEESRRHSDANDGPVIEEREWQWARPQIEGVAPSARGGHSSTLVGASLVIFGGHFFAGSKEGYVYLNDTHVLDVDANSWHQPRLGGAAPAPRYGHSATLVGSRIVIFGGRGDNNTSFRDLHALDTSTMTWYQGPEGGGGSPAGRFGHSATLVGARLFVFGGWNGSKFFNDLHILDLEAMVWTAPPATGAVPVARYSHGSVLIGTNVLIFGGFAMDPEKEKKLHSQSGTALKECYLNDVRVLDTDTCTWSRLRISGTPPTGRHGMSFCLSGEDILVFGGWSGISRCSICGITVGRGSSSHQPDCPIGLAEAGRSDDGSRTGSNTIDYFHVLSTRHMTWRQGKNAGLPPGKRYGHTATPIGPHLIMFGGWDGSKALSEVVVLRDKTGMSR